MRLISTTLAGPGTEGIVGDALRSVAPLVDDRFVVWTGAGGIDDVVRLRAGDGSAPSETMRIDAEMSGRVYWRAWSWSDDFGAARNALLDGMADEATRVGLTWMVMVDTDERIVCPDPAAVRAFLEALPPEVEVVVALAADGSHGRERFFRLPAKRRWIGRTHEAFPVDCGQQATIPSELIAWTELPKTPEQLRARAERDVDMLAAEIAERPKDPRWRAYRGFALETLGRVEEALGEYIAASELGHGEDSVIACYCAANLLLHAGRYDEALVAAARGMALNATFGELPWIAGCAATHLGRPDQALAWARLAKVHGVDGEGKGALAERVGHRAAGSLRDGPAQLIATAQRGFELMRDQALDGMGIGAAAGEVATSGEREVLEVVKRRAGEGPIVVFDVGANRGAYTMLALDMLGAQAKITAFEPDRAAVRCFDVNGIAASLRATGSPFKVDLLPFALSDTTGASAFNAYEDPSLSSFHARRLMLRGMPAVVEKRRLDDVCEERTVDHIDLLKIDVEGHELHVLRGAAGMIERGAIDAIQFEFGGANVDSRTFLRDFFDLLSPRYAIHRVTRDGLVPVEYHERHEAFSTTNFLALSRAKVTPPAKLDRCRAIVFSKDRPLQLDACLRSLKLHCKDVDALAVHVLCKASTPAFGEAYRELIAATPWAAFHPEQDFERDVRGLLGGCDHVLFVVDDSIFVRDFRVDDLVAALCEFPEAIGFSLRLGENTVYCYPAAREQSVPRMTSLGVADRPWCRSWAWASADGDFAYPLEVSSSLYRVADLPLVLRNDSFANPNALEVALACAAPRIADIRPLLLCAAPHSLAFSMPLNRVQATHANRSSESPALTAQALLAVWQRGARVNVADYAGYTPRACHEEAPLFLVEEGRIPDGFRVDVSVSTPVHITVTSTALRAGESAGRCVRSVREQRFGEWSHVYVAGDSATYSAAWRQSEVGGSRRGDIRQVLDEKGDYLAPFPPLLENLLPVWRSLPDDEVIVWLDGDDWLATDEALAIVAEEHHKGALATYGSFMLPDGRPILCGPCGANPRAEPWRASHLKSFRAGLAKRIRDEDLRRPDGAYVDLAIDRAVMLPIVEMAGERAVYIPRILCVYNTAHSFEVNASAEAKAREAAEVARIHALPRYHRVAWP